MTRWMADTCWEKLCNNILVIKTLKSSVLLYFIPYILWSYKTARMSHLKVILCIHTISLCIASRIVCCVINDWGNIVVPRSVGAECGPNLPLRWHYGKGFPGKFPMTPIGPFGPRGRLRDTRIKRLDSVRVRIQNLYSPLPITATITNLNSILPMYKFSQCYIKVSVLKQT